MIPRGRRTAPWLASLACLLAQAACAPPPLREDHESLGLGIGVLVAEDVEFSSAIPGVSDDESIRVTGGGFAIDRYLGDAWIIGGGIDYRSYRPRDRDFPDAEAAELIFRVRRSFWHDRVMQPYIGIGVFTALEWHLEDGSQTSPYLGIAPTIGFTWFQEGDSSWELALAWVRTVKAPAVEEAIGGALGGAEGYDLDFEGLELTWWVNYWF